MRSLATLEALPDEAIHAILRRADEAIEEEIRNYLAANRAWHLSRPAREDIEAWVKQAREWRNDNGSNNNA
jgi:hypothetical protein